MLFHAESRYVKEILVSKNFKKSALDSRRERFRRVDRRPQRLL